MQRGTEFRTPWSMITHDDHHCILLVPFVHKAPQEAQQVGFSITKVIPQVVSQVGEKSKGELPRLGIRVEEILNVFQRDVCQ